MTRSPDLFSDPTPLLREVQETERGYREVKQQLPEIERQFLEAKRRYRLFREIVLLRRELFIRSFRRLEELARVRRLRCQTQDSGPIQQNDPAADAQRSRLAQNLKESFLKLQKTRELIRDGENLLRRQQRALKSRRQHAAAQVQPDQEMRDNALRLQKLKELYRIQQELLLRHERALCVHDAAAAVQQVPNRDCDNCDASALPKQPGEPRGERRSARTRGEGAAACGRAPEETGEPRGERRSARTRGEGAAACGRAREENAEPRGERRPARTRGEGAAACGRAREENAEPQLKPILMEQPLEAKPATPALPENEPNTGSRRKPHTNTACRNSVWKKAAWLRSAAGQSARHNKARPSQQNFQRTLQQGNQFRRHRCVGFSAAQDLIARGPPWSAIGKVRERALEKGQLGGERGQPGSLSEIGFLERRINVQPPHPMKAMSAVTRDVGDPQSPLRSLRPLR